VNGSIVNKPAVQTRAKRHNLSEIRPYLLDIKTVIGHCVEVSTIDNNIYLPGRGEE